LLEKKARGEDIVPEKQNEEDNDEDYEGGAGNGEIDL
jgi:hypothetical protein